MRLLASSTTPRQGRRRPGGFTLVELIAVLLIVAIMAGVAVPTLGSISGTRASMAARQLLRDMTFARQRALATGTTCWVKFDTTAKTWTLLRDDPSNPGLANAIILADMATGSTYVTTLGSGQYIGVDFNSCNFDTDTSVGFNWLGEPLKANGTALAAQGSAVLTNNHQITVNASTGMVTHITP